MLFRSWMALFEWVRGRRPSRGAAVGLPVGFAGVALLAGPATFIGSGQIDPAGTVVLMIASASWAVGSLYSRHASLPNSPLLGTAMQMVAGGALLLAAGSAANEWPSLDLSRVSAASAIAVVYLVLIGSLVGFTAYIWLLKVSTPARVSTYAYVNPLVAVVLGSVFLGEALTARTLLGVTIILTSVALITSVGARGRADRKSVV